jgi:hypothetical protein
VIPALVDYLSQGGKWTAMAWWIHDHLPYSSMCFFAQLGAFNLGWHENPVRRIDSYAAPKGCLVKPGMAGFAGSHAKEYADLLAFVKAQSEVITAGAAPRMDVPNLTLGFSQPVVPEEVIPRTPTPSHNTTGTRPVQYRAVHTKNGWRKANHASLEKAIYGKAGAFGLFSGKIKTDYALHGKPLTNEQPGAVRLWSFGGTRANRTIAKQINGLTEVKRIDALGLDLRWSIDTSEVNFELAIKDIAFSADEVTDFAKAVKFSDCLPEDLLLEIIQMRQFEPARLENK